jgi:hypothetical protein
MAIAFLLHVEGVILYAIPVIRNKVAVKTAVVQAFRPAVSRQT